MGRPADQIEALQARVRELEGRCRAYVARIGALRTALKLTSLDVHDAEGAAKALGEDDDTADAERLERLTKAQEATPADVPPVLGSPADIWIPNTETTTPPVLVAGDAPGEGRAAWFAEIGLKAPTPVEAAHAADEDEAPAP